MMKYGAQKAKLLFTDTDSLTYHIQMEDIYQDMKQDQDLFDTSEYPTDHFLHSTVNKKVIGKFKDETAGDPVMEWVGLRAKMYSMLTKGGEENKKGKGIKKSVLKKEVHHQDFKDCLFERREFQHSMMGFHSHQHQLFTEKQTKKSLSPFDDKRYILEDGYTTRAHGHHLNNITRPSEATKSTEEGLINALSVFAVSSNHTSPTDVMAIPPPPPVTTSSNFHSYLASFWS